MRLFAALALCALTGCAAFHRETITIDSDPPGARVRLDGLDIGRTPATFKDRGGTGKTYAVEVAKPGYETRKVGLKQEVRRSCIFAAAPGLIIPLFLINLVWCHSLPEKQYQVNLDPLPGSVAPSVECAFDGTCEAPPPPPPEGCRFDADCPEGRRCDRPPKRISGTCVR